MLKIPPNLQCPGVDEKDRLWALQMPAGVNLNMCEQVSNKF